MYRCLQAKGKMRKAEKTLHKVLKNLEPEKLPTDLETLTDEERVLFRRIGFSMKPFLVLGKNSILSFGYYILEHVSFSFFTNRKARSI